ncbi:MAG: HflK protein [Candidatus Muproteobacteria bacterium RBG_16_64_11]|uniref:Protein HflK n=1 Tax=Candidatus Muproteobacteria bacterium RBG_16_64_11 TaxID=1817758 RepID=A0A1F6T9J8_9PROT|nr:MAG: HflK protein [Candidatus Muproteobacteria bacterium RBG_16_64_11]
MAWNEPGPGGKEPWGQRKKTQGPPDLDQILKNLQERARGLFGGKGRGGGGEGGANKVSGFGAGLIAVVAVILWLASGFYIVNEGQRGVVLQFGAKTEITDAGLHWRWPFPFETVEKVNVSQVSTIEIGYRKSDKTGGTSKVPKEALMLTQDENILDIEFAVQYKIKDAADYLFNVRDIQNTLMSATESAVREVVGKSDLDFIITEGRDQVGQNTRALLQEIMDRYKSGIQIVTVQMQKALPPEEVKAAFDDAVKAREDEQRLKNEAEAFANDMIPRARGNAARMLQEAEGYKASVIARAEGDAKRFSQIVAEYAKAPGVTRDRLYIETMERVFSNTTKILVDQKAGNNILYLPLDKLVSQGATRTAGPVNTLQPLPEPDSTAPAGGRDRARDSQRTRGAP